MIVLDLGVQPDQIAGMNISPPVTPEVVDTDTYPTSEVVNVMPPDQTITDANGNTTNVKFVPMPGAALTEADFDRIEAAAQKRIRKQARNVAIATRSRS